MTSPTALDIVLDALAAGGRRHASRDDGERAALARATARAVAAAADRWIEAARVIKQVPAGGPLAAVATAEEAATGPLVTLRLLLITAQALDDVARHGVPRPARPPRIVHPGAGTGASYVAVDVLPAGLCDSIIFRGHSATVRCVNPGGLEAFMGSWREEVRTRPRTGGVAVVLGAGNVTGLVAADAVSQVFEHGRAVLMKLHPLHAPLEPVLRDALAPLVAAGLVEIVAGGVETARAAVAAPQVTHVHLTGGQAAFDALVWGGPGPRPPDARPVLGKPVTCELGNVTPWIVVPGRYTPAQLRFQADSIAASIANNTSFNCIATKCVITCRSWPQRQELHAAIAGRLERLPARPAWYPGAAAAWEERSGRAVPADGTLPAVFREIDPATDRRWLDREWFVPVAAEAAVEADSVEAFCRAATDLVRSLPGSLAASVTVPPSLSASDARRVELLCEHLGQGVVAVNTWSALAYSFGNVPWGGFPGGTLAEPRSGIGRVHDPYLLPLVHDAILRVPLATAVVPPWFPWHRHAARLTRGVVEMYGAIATGRSGVGALVKMLPWVLAG